ncbi:hypothetical protein Tco_1320867 [Tanacetum coccineum]
MASSSSKSSSTKGDVLEGGGVSSNVTLSDSLTFLVRILKKWTKSKQKRTKPDTRMKEREKPRAKCALIEEKPMTSP